MTDGLTSAEIFGILIVVIVCVALAAVGLLMLQRLRRRRDQIRGELSGRPEAVSDRAFNRIAMARRESGVLVGQGVEVARAQELIGSAQASFDRRDFDRAYELAQTAHETLVVARQRPPTPTPLPAARAEPTPIAPISSTASVPAMGPSPTPAAKIPAHRVESQFQLELLREEIARAGAAGANDGRLVRARTFASDAQTAFDRGDYAESFRLALKGRREAGGAVEAVAPPSGPAGAPAGPVDPSQAAEALAAADRCPSCGHPTGPKDAFCRGCGIPRRAAATCPTCGAERLPTDTFCAGCGAAFA